MSRVICVALALLMVGCGQNVTSFAPNGLQSTTTPNAGATRAKPDDEVVAHVMFKDENKFNPYYTEFTIYVSYDREPWFVYSRECVKAGDTVLTDVYYREPNKKQQIKFSAEKASREIFNCSLFRGGHRTVAFHSIYFKSGSADFRVVYDVDSHNGRPTIYTLCAEGGGWNKICDDKGH